MAAAVSVSSKKSIFELVEKNLPRIKTGKNKQGIVYFVLDRSGSTGTMFKNGMTVLEKEMEIIRLYILLHGDTNKYYLISFDSKFINHGEINVLYEEGLVNLPNLLSGSSTYTAEPLLDILANLSHIFPTEIICITDGQTDSSPAQFMRFRDGIQKHKIKFSIIAVTRALLDLTTIRESEEKVIPGMDLLGLIGNIINQLSIYTPQYDEKPFEAIVSSAKLTIARSDFSGTPPFEIINLLLEIIRTNLDIDWGVAYADLKSLLTDIGKLLTMVFVSFDNDHYIVTRILHILSEAIPDFAKDRMLGIIVYGFNCTKQNVPLSQTNLDEKAKSESKKQEEFKEAEKHLRELGPTFGGYSISVPFGNIKVGIINHGGIIVGGSAAGLTNASDEHGNLYISTDPQYAQAIRQAMRAFLALHNFPNASRGQEVIFYITSLMAKMLLEGLPLDNEYMQELQKLGSIQCSMDILVAPGKRMPAFSLWLEGILPRMHFSNEGTHPSLNRCREINPWLLTEPIWWALQMCMLGIFDKQLKVYEHALIALNIEPTSESFLRWFVSTYKDSVTGKYIIEKFETEPVSVITLDEFVPGTQLFSLPPHGPIGNVCKTLTCYTEEEIRKIGRCVWCNSPKTLSDYVEHTHISNSTKLQNLMARGIITDASGGGGDIVAQTIITDASGGGGSCIVAPTIITDASGGGGGGGGSSIVAPVVPSNKPIQYWIYLLGITGAGKTTITEKLEKELIRRGFIVFIVSADKYMKQGFSGKNLQKKINDDILRFNISKHPWKVIICDMCNENGISNTSFGFDILKNGYTILKHMPNLTIELLKEYECWCLRNVLSRVKQTEKCNYMLNPCDATVQTCIAVHNKKAAGIARQLKQKNRDFDITKSKEAIMAEIEIDATKYAEHLATRSLDAEIQEIISKIV